MSLVAQVEGWDWLDGDVRLEAETVVGTITGLAHAGGESQEAADGLLYGYWVIVVEDRNHNGELDMEDYPCTLMELESRFSTEEACRTCLFGLRWPGGFAGERCGNGSCWHVGLRNAAALHRAEDDLG